MIKDEKKFNKYMTTQEKVSNVVKKLIVNLYIIPVILFDSVYRKYENYYLKLFFKKFIHNFF